MSIKVEHVSDIDQQLQEAFHDMRQPLAAELALAAAALTEPDLPGAARDRLKQIIEQAGWLADMIHGCLVARWQAKPDEIENPDHDLADIVQVIGEGIAVECPTWPGEVTLSAPAGPVWCGVPLVPLRRAVSNVLDNATRAAGPTGGDRRNPAAKRRRNARGGGRRTGFRENTKRCGPGVVRGSQKCRHVRRKNGMQWWNAWGRTRQPLASRVESRPRGAGPMRLVLCDDNRILCDALGVALEARGHSVLATATTTMLGIAEVARYRPDACVLDLRFPEPPDGLGAAGVIRHRYPETAVLVLSSLADPATMAEATRIGVAGVLGKDQSVDHIAGALNVIASGGTVYAPVRTHSVRSNEKRRYYPARDLTSREKEVLRRIVAGQSTMQMSREMNVATSTLRTYVKNMLAKLGAHTRLEAAVLATRENLLGDQKA